MSGYDEDILIWSEQQAALLRRLAPGERVNDLVDWENVTEEIESVGRSERAALASHVRVILQHLARLEASPAAEPLAGWIDSVLRARAGIDALLESSQGLRPGLHAATDREMLRVRPLVAASLAAHNEAPRVPIAQLRYDMHQVLGPWLPDTPAA